MSLVRSGEPVLGGESAEGAEAVAAISALAGLGTILLGVAVVLVRAGAHCWSRGFLLLGFSSIPIEICIQIQRDPIATGRDPGFQMHLSEYYGR